MKSNNKANKSRLISSSARIMYPLVLSLLLSGCSYYGGQLSYFDLTNDNKKLANRQAAKKFWASVRPKSNLSDAHYRLGLHYQQIGEHEKAIGEFTKALGNDSKYCKAYNGIAMAYDFQKRCELARSAYELAVNCAPGEAYVYNNYACSSLLCGDYGKGMELLQKAESLAKNENRIKNNLIIARTIAIHQNISEYFAVAGSPLPAAVTETTSAPPLPKNEKMLPEVLMSKLSEATELQENSSNIASPAMEINDKATDDQTAAFSGVTKIPAQPSRVALSVATVSDNLFVETNDKPLPNPTISVPVKVSIEVSNGNGATGMAKRSADFLRGQGFIVRSVTNAKHFRFEESTIYYKKEYLQAAKDLAAVIPGAQNLEQVETMAKPSIGVRVLLGRDLLSIRFPGGYDGLANYRQTEQSKPAVLTASHHPVHY